MYWLKIWGGIDSENVIPYGTIRSDAEEIHKREVREAELYMTFITRYADVIPVLFSASRLQTIKTMLGDNL